MSLLSGRKVAWRTRRGSLYAIVLVVAGTACQPRRAEIPGRYRATYPFGVETLVLLDTGTYQQEFRLHNGGLVVMQSGHWSYDDRDGQIQLENALPVVDGFGHLERDYSQAREGFRGLLARRGPRGTRLVINEDLDLYFERTDS